MKLAQPIRLLLEYTETKFEDKMMRCGPAPDYDKTCWFGIKHSLGLDFPNLPYYVDGDLKITQGGNNSSRGDCQQSTLRWL